MMKLHAQNPLTEADLSPAVQKHAGPGAPAPLKMMTAKGLAPLPPADLVAAQTFLAFDKDENLQAAARDSLKKLDERIAKPVLSNPDMPSGVLSFLAEMCIERDDYIELLLLNRATPVSAVVWVATAANQSICELIAENQARLLEEPEIARALIGNGTALKSTIDRVVDFLVRNGVVLDGVKEFEDALLRLTGEDRRKAAEAIELPQCVVADRHAASAEASQEATAEDGADDRRFIEEDEDDAPEEEERLTVEQQVRNMSTAQKVAAATRGTKQVRGILMRDTNRVVALAAISAPTITESEVVAAAQSRTVHQDVVAYIAKDKKNNWVKIYAVKLALVQNPKAPLPVAMKLVPFLQKRDLKTVASSRMVPGGVRNLAKKIMRQQTR